MERVWSDPLQSCFLDERIEHGCDFIAALAFIGRRFILLIAPAIVALLRLHEFEVSAQCLRLALLRRTLFSADQHQRQGKGTLRPENRRGKGRLLLRPRREQCNGFIGGTIAAHTRGRLEGIRRISCRCGGNGYDLCHAVRPEIRSSLLSATL
ncbi:hypothetical protein NGR_c15520 [Sinorhizobium fredii NGR234]|uniref:Uncharacterized protein n=1 Tax=Sinorhizobium fredii (strain NBRC 101917 / NGR234) TaxID=394 RepID=C3MD01_SINFN|nr:hypothetical protein NGR_c15520 [Sinorhizobium fredii NGR234]